MNPSGKIRVGVIGAGWWATFNHMPRLLDQPLDAVVISSPHHLHHEHASAALDRGLHVMCEKPMTLDPAQAWDLVRRAERAGKVLLIPYGWNYKPFSQEAKRLMNDGIVGRVDYALCHMASPTKEFFGGGSVDVMSQWEPTLAKPEPATWQAPENGGGYAHGQVTHSSALLMWLTGLRAQQVSARITGPDSPVDMYNAASVTFEGGAIGTISGAATLPANDPFQVDLRVFGTDGTLLIDMERERMVVRRHDGSHHETPIEPGSGAYDCNTPPGRFIDVIRGEASNDSPGELGARTVELISAMFASSEAGGAVTPVYRDAPAGATP